MSAFVQALENGIHVIDTGYVRDRFDAAYLVVEDGRGAFIDTGTNYALPRLLDALGAAGVSREAVDWVIPTHVHLDHAGGAGALMRELPNARCVVHPRGARHLIDPAALEASARGVYGDAEFERSYGRIVPVDAARVVETHDGMVLDFAGRRLVFLDTPGHARHHHCIWDETSRTCFTGDTFGISYRELDSETNGAWILPTTTPVQYDPDALVASIARLLALKPKRMCLTHYGPVEDVQRLGAALIEIIDAMNAIGLRLRSEPDRPEQLRAALRELYVERVREHGAPLADAQVAELLSIDVELNAQGMAYWLDRKPAAG